MKSTNYIYKGLTVLLISLILFSEGWTTTYYINITNGNDNNDGISPSTAWKTIAKVNATNFEPADFILFKRGETWRDQLIISSFGTSSNPITFGAYGSGNRPLITAADLINPWTHHTGQIWKTYRNKQVLIVSFDGTLGIRVNSLDDIDAPCKWYWSGNDDWLYVYSTENPELIYKNPGIEVGIRADAILIEKNYITIEDLEVRGAIAGTDDGGGIHIVGDYVTVENCVCTQNFYAGIYIHVAEHITLSNCITYQNHDCGIKMSAVNNVIINDCLVCKNGYGNQVRSGILFDGNYVTISRCTVYENGNGCDELGVSHGIYAAGSSVPGGSDNLVIEDCIVYGNRKGNGISCCANNAEIRRNRVYDNAFMGIIVDQQYSGGVINIYQNIIHDNCRGISLYNYYFNSEAQVFIYNNVCYKNDNLNPYGLEINSYELDIQVEPRVLKIKNNIFYHTSGHAVIVSWADQNAYGDFVSDYNCFYKMAGADDPKFTYWNGQYMSFAEWQAATGGDGNSLATDPLLIDLDNHDVYLQADSPCIDAGADVGITQDFEGNNVPQGNKPDIGAFEFGGKKGISPPRNVRVFGSLLR